MGRSICHEARHDGTIRRLLVSFMMSDEVIGARSGSPRQYEIWVRGHLGEMMRSAFPALQDQTQGDSTVLTGVLADQAALYGVLAECEALGLELLEVRSLDRQNDRHEAARQ